MSGTVNKSDIVIIGGVAAGPKAAATLARRMPKAKITVLQKEKYMAYAGCGLPYLASGDIGSFKELTLTAWAVVKDYDYFKEAKGFELITEAEVIKIDRDKKAVTVKMIKKGETVEHHYDKLVIATGADPNEPSFPVVEHPNIRPFTRPDDAIHFRKTAEQGGIEKAIIIGGGFIGCEMAEAAGGLWGIETALIEKENQLLPHALDAEMSRIVERHLKKQDVEVILNAEIEKIDLDEEESPTIHIKGNNALTADYVLLCLGVKPETALARECGLDIGETGGILVNDNLQTSDPDIYAGGDCIESYNLVSGKKLYMPMGSLANTHGRIIAENIAGNKSVYPGTVGAFLLKVFDINVGTVGLSERAAADAGLNACFVWGTFADRPDYYPESKTFAMKIVYEEGTQRLLGLQAVGAGNIARHIDSFSLFLKNNSKTDDLFTLEHGYAPPYSEPQDPLHHLAGMAKAQQKGISFISPDIKSDEEIIWLDVREADQVEAMPWPFADSSKKQTFINIPLNDIRKRMNELNPDKKTVIICGRGPRAYQAVIILNEAGFKNLHILGGGALAALS